MPRTTDSNTTLSLTATSLSALYPESLSGEESLNALGSHILNGINDGASLTLTTAVASHVTTTLHKDALLRPLDLLVAEIRQLPADATAERYQLLLRPWLWWLSLASNNRVFQNLATSDIVTTIFKAHGFTDFQLKLTGSYTPREYCVQYGETDLAFVSRLLEEDGIFWFFTHEEGTHTLVLADSNDAFAPIPNGPTVNYLGQIIGERELHGIRSGQVCLQAVAGVYQATDYEFTTPTTSLYSQAEAVAGPSSMYEHPGGYTAKAQGDALTKQRVDGLRSQGETFCRRKRLPLAGARVLVHPRRPRRHDAEYRLGRDLGQPRSQPRQLSQPLRSDPQGHGLSTAPRHGKNRACTPRRRWWWARPAKKSGPMNMAGSNCSSPGTAPARTTRPHPVGSAWSCPGAAKALACSSYRASARKSS
nr:hypothetical protein GCM10020185_68700 [Pseudomonas brassicacearum subsp. brassicacearum]